MTEPPDRQRLYGGTLASTRHCGSAESCAAREEQGQPRPSIPELSDWTTCDSASAAGDETNAWPGEVTASDRERSRASEGSVLTHDITVLARNRRPSKLGALVLPPTTRRARSGRATTAPACSGLAMPLPRKGSAARRGPARCLWRRSVYGADHAEWLGSSETAQEARAIGWRSWAVAALSGHDRSGGGVVSAVSACQRASAACCPGRAAARLPRAVARRPRATA